MSRIDRVRGLSLAAATLVFSLVGPLAAQTSTEQPSAKPIPPAEGQPAAVPAVAVMPPTPAPAPAPMAAKQRSPFSGRLYSWASLGTTFAYNQTYGSANVGAGYLMQHGIAPNVELGYAFGNSPTVWSLRPGVTWYMPVAMIHPYVGAHYSHWFVGGNLQDQNGIGGRAGFSLGRVISFGLVYDHALDCNANCDIWAPQISAGLSL
jgi:hypothetical protein